MNDIAHLNMAVDSTDTDKAAKSLDNLADFAEKAEKATGALGQAVQKNAKEYKNLSDMADDLAKSEKKAIQQMHERARAQTKSMSAGVAAMQATERSAQSMSQYAAETEKLRAGLTKLLTAIDPLEARLNKLDKAEGKLNETFKRGIIDADKYAESLAKIGAQRNDIAEKQLKEIGDGAEYAAGMMEKLGLGTRIAQQDLMNLGRAAAQGDLKQVQSSIFQLTRNTNVLSLSLSGAVTAAGAVVGSMALLGAAYYKGYQQTQEFNRSIALTGNALGTSAGEMARMTAEVGRLSGSYAQAEQAANLIVRSGRIASDSIQDVMKTAVEMQQAFGQSVDQTISEFDRLGESPSQTLLELNEKYHFLTAAVYEQVRALEDQGRMEEATALAQAEASRALDGRAAEVIENVGWMERSWRNLGFVVAATWEAIANVGKDDTIDQELERLNEKLKSQQKVLDERVDRGRHERAIKLAEDEIKATKEQIAIREEEKRNLEAINKLEGEIAKHQKEQINISNERQAYVKTHTKSTLASELAKANEELKQVTAGLDKESAEYAKVMEAHYNRVEQINKRYEKSTRSGGASGNQFAAEVARLKARIAEERDLSKAVEETITQVTRLNQFERKAMQLREQASKETKAGTKAQLEKLAALNEEAGALVRNNKLAEEAAKERLKYLEGLEKSTKSTYDEAQKLRDQAQTMGMSRMALEALTTARIEEQIAQLRNKEGSEEEIKLLEDLLAARENLTEAVGQHEMARASYKAQQDLEQDWKRTVDNIDSVFRRGFADMLNEGRGNWTSFTKSLTTTFKTAVADQIYKMFMKPFVAQVAIGLTGGLGMGGVASAGQQNVAMGFDVLRTANTAYSAFSGGLTSSLSNGIGFLGEQFGSSALSSFAAGMTGTLASSISAVAPSAAASLGTSLTGATMANTAFSSSVAGSGLSGAFGAGAGLAAAMPWITGGLAVAALLPSISKMFKGEKRAGGRWAYDKNSSQAQFYEGPSGGYGGQATTDAMTQAMGSAVSMIDSVFEAVGVQAEVAAYKAMFESSGKGRGGTFSGGTLLIDGQEVSFGTNVKGAGYGSRSASAEQSFEDMTKDMAFSALEAWQLVADQMPDIIGGSLKGVDVRALSAEQAAAMANEIQVVVASTNAFINALNELPFSNLKELSFDASAAMLQLFGGVEQAMQGLGVYYQEFYSESERIEHAIANLTRNFAELGYELPASREAYRELVDSIDVSSESGQELYVQLIQMSGAFASVTEGAEGLELGLNGMAEDLSELMRLLSTLPFNHLIEMGEETVRVLAEMAGGIDAFASSLGGYYQNFFTEQERFIAGAGVFVNDLSELGLALPATRDGFRGMMDSIDLTTTAGQEMFAALLGTAEQADDYYRYVEQTTQNALAELAQSVAEARQKELTDLKASQTERMQALREQQSSELKALRDSQSARSKALRNQNSADSKALRDSQNARSKALREEQQQAVKAVRDSYNAQAKAIRDSISSINEKLSELNSLSNQIERGLDSLRGFSDLAVGLHRDASKGLVDQAVQLAQAGKSLVGFDGLSDAVNALSQLDAEDFTSRFDYELERAESVNALSKLGDLTSGQVDVQELQLTAMEKQLERLDVWRDKQIETLNQIAERELEQQRVLFEKEREDLAAYAERQTELMNGLFEKEQASLATRSERHIQEMKDLFDAEQLALNEHFDTLLKQEQKSLEQQITEMLNMQANQAALANIVESTSLQQYAQLISIESAIGSAASRIASAVSNISVSVNMGMPAFADGGRYSGGLALVGERGPEIINFDKPGMVYTAAQSRNLMANAGAGNDETAGLLRQLIGEIKEMRYETRQMVINTAKILGLVDDATESAINDESIVVTY